MVLSVQSAAMKKAGGFPVKNVLNALIATNRHPHLREASCIGRTYQFTYGFGQPIWWQRTRLELVLRSCNVSLELKAMKPPGFCCTDFEGQWWLLIENL